MHRILKPTGSIFLHCDWHANAYIRVLILDKIFGTSNFKNEITWQRTTTHNDTKQGAKHFGRVTDTIFIMLKIINYLFLTHNTNVMPLIMKHLHTVNKRKMVVDLKPQTFRLQKVAVIRLMNGMVKTAIR